MRASDGPEGAEADGEDLASGRLAGLATNELVGVADALALVGLRRTQGADLGRDLTDELLVDALITTRGFWPRTVVASTSMPSGGTK